MISAFTSGCLYEVKYALYISFIALIILNFSTGAFQLSTGFVIFSNLFSVMVLAIGYLCGFYQIHLQNTLGSLLALVNLVAIYLLLQEKDQTSGVSNRICIFFSLMLSLILIYFAKSRAPLMMYFVICISYFVLSVLKLSDKQLKQFFYLLVVIILLVLLGYVLLPAFDSYEFFNQFSKSFFGKNIDSSRARLWKEAFSLIGEHWFWGVGYGTFQEGEFIGNSYHNSFFQILIQIGLIGLIIFLIILKKIWYTLVCIEDKEKKVVALSFFVGIMFYNCFETTLFCNKLTIGFIEWLLLSLMMRDSEHFCGY